MASPRDYHDADFPQAFRYGRGLILKIGRSPETMSDVEVRFSIVCEYGVNAQFLAFFVPNDEDPNVMHGMCRALINCRDRCLDSWDGLDYTVGLPGDRDHSRKRLVFTRQIIFYVDGALTADQRADIERCGDELDLFVRIRDRTYADARSLIEKPMCFISHDSRDKEAIARPLIAAFARRGIGVWYDEFSLKPGDSLRESIERGLRETKRCVLVLTPHFLSNPGWTKREFNAVFHRELLQKTRVILPIWSGISRDQIYEYCPELLDRVAIIWDEAGADADARAAVVVAKLAETLKD